jgi:hypothetical protein
VSARVTVTYEASGHPGWDAVRFMHRLLMIDEEWTEWHDDGFTWWAYGLAQRYRWVGTVDVNRVPTWFLSVETDFLRGATDRYRALEFVNRWNASIGFGVGALVLEGERIRFRSRTYAMPESAESRARTLSSWGIITDAVASRLAVNHEHDRNSLAAQGFDPSWSADGSGHPVGGPRDVPDEMLTVIERVFLPEGQQPARETTDLGLDEAVHWLMGAGADAVGGDFSGSLLAQGPGSYGQLTWSVECAFQHPVLGFGVRSRLFVDLARDRYPLSLELAHGLNELEGSAGQPLVGGGAWAVSEEGEPRTLVYTAFFANADLAGQLAPMMAVNNMRYRREWLKDALVVAAAGVGTTG